MISKLRNLYKAMYLKKLKKIGLIVGENFQMEKGCSIDTPFAWLIKIGDNVTLASRVYILAHDASTKKILNYSKVGRVNIGNNVFIGAHSIILPNVNIGDNCIIGANSVVSKDVKPNTVVAGNPAKEICSLEEFKIKNNKKLDKGPVYDVSWTLRGNITKDRKEKMKKDLKNNLGYID